MQTQIQVPRQLAQVTLGEQGWSSSTQPRCCNPIRWKNTWQERKHSCRMSSGPLPTNSFSHKKSLLEQSARKTKKKAQRYSQAGRHTNAWCHNARKTLTLPYSYDQNTPYRKDIAVASHSHFRGQFIQHGNHTQSQCRCRENNGVKGCGVVSSHAVKNISVGVSALAWCEWGLMGGAAELH